MCFYLPFGIIHLLIADLEVFIREMSDPVASVDKLDGIAYNLVIQYRGND